MKTKTWQIKEHTVTRLKIRVYWCTCGKPNCEHIQEARRQQAKQDIQDLFGKEEL